MRTVPVLSADEAAKLVSDNAVITVSSSSGLGCPDAVLEAVGARFAQHRRPANLTSIHPIAAGDMYGIKGIDHLCAPGQLTRVFAGSYPSGGSKLDPPLIRQRIHGGEIQAYNIPSGVLFQMHRAASTGQPGVLTEVGLGTYADPRIEGAKMNDVTADFIELMTVGGSDYLFYPAVKVDVAIIRATTADAYGNLSYEQEGGTLGALDQAYAAHNNGGIVIAQVKRLSDDQLRTQDVHVPGVLVDAVVVAPDQMQTTQTFYDPALSGEVHRGYEDIEPVEFGLEKIIARRAASELEVDATVNLGFGISAAVPRILLEEGHAEDVTWVIEQGAVGGFPLTGFAFGCALNPQALVQSVDQFTLLQGGGFDVAMLSFLEVSAAGDVNVSYLPARPHVTAGVGGFNDIITRAPKIVYSGYFTAGKKDIRIENGELKIITDGQIAKFVPEVAQISFSGQMAQKRQQNVLYVTERCVIELQDEGLTVIEIAPGVDLERDVLAKAGVPLLVSPKSAHQCPRRCSDPSRWVSRSPAGPPASRTTSSKRPGLGSALHRTTPPKRNPSTPMPATHYDYVIVGAGAAGCAVANRLSADPRLHRAAPRSRRPRLVPAGAHAGRVHQAQRPALQLGVLDGAAAGVEQPADVVSPGPNPGRQHLDQRDDLHPRPARGLPGMGGTRQRGLGLRAGAAVLPARRGQRAAQRPVPQQRRRGERHRTGPAQPAQQGLRPGRAGARGPVHR